jgi:hypothetical protein
MEVFAERLDSAREWLAAAIGDAQAGRWSRDAVARRVVADLVAATAQPGGWRMPPFDHHPLAVRIENIARWDGLLRAAAQAGGWGLQPVTGRRPARPAGMSELLSAIHAIGAQGTIWSERLRAGDVPAERDLARAESFFTGPGTIEDLESHFYD